MRSAVPSRVSLLILQAQVASIYLYRHTQLGQSRVYLVKQLRTDDAHCRESSGIGPVFLKVV